MHVSDASAQVSPKLLTARDLMLAVPGTYHGRPDAVIPIRSFLENIQARTNPDGGFIVWLIDWITGDQQQAAPA